MVQAMARWKTKATVALLVGAAGGIGLAELERRADTAFVPLPTTTAPGPSGVGSPSAPDADRAPDPLREAACPAGAQNCAAVTGRVMAIESVDPDGDGDLHVVALGGGVTAPGVTVFDVSAALRPERDPRVGQRVTGAGPVFTGSHGQRQIQVTEFRVAR
jgi:hypothetical protein